MIGLILELLSVSEFYGQGELIDFAKGSRKLEHTIKAKEEQLRRKKWQKK
jgi:hypothetical protein